MSANLRIKATFGRPGEERFLGPGVIDLLKHLQHEPSLTQGAIQMNMSYSKATKIVNRLEKEFNTPILNRAHGGHSRAGSTLTPFAVKLITEWDKFEEAVMKVALPLAEEFTKEIGLQ